MNIVRRAIIMVISVVSGAICAQGPEFAQQYRQRLAGALDELQAIAAEFDQQALAYGLDRGRALNLYAQSGEAFLRDRGMSMRALLTRHDRLAEQLRALTTEAPLARPLVVLTRPDPRILVRAWEDFEPAVPVTPAGFVWAGLGALLAAILASIASLPMGRRRPRRKAGTSGRDAATSARRNSPSPAIAAMTAPKSMMSGAEMDKRWSKGVTLALEGPETFTVIDSAQAAAWALIEDWPLDDGVALSRALDVCTAVSEGKRPPDDARQAFVEAAREAGIAMRD